MAQAPFHQHKIPHALVWILKSKGKSLHDRMDAPIGVIDFLLVEKLDCQNYKVLNLFFLEFIGKNQTFHKH